MKINERCLIHIAQSDDNPIDKCGWLHKLGDDKKTFNKKWFVLKENILFYYNQKSDKEPYGAIILDGHRVEIIESSYDEYFTFKIDFGTSRFGHQLKCFILAASNQSEMEGWIKSISCASYDYLKMVISELQHRLDELNHKTKIKPDDNSTLLFKTNQLIISESRRARSETPNNLTKRFNPFDHDANTDSENIVDNLSFLDLHEKYGRIIRKYFL